MKFRYKKEVKLSLQVLVILLIFTALGVSGANSAARAFADNAPKKSVQPDPAKSATFSPDPQSADAAGDQMAPSSRPNTEQSACFTIPVIIKTVEDNSQFRLHVDARIPTVSLLDRDGISADPISSTSLISSSLGRQFRLVGARPSGTS